MQRFRLVRVSLCVMALCVGLAVAGSVGVVADDPTATPLPPAPTLAPSGTALAAPSPIATAPAASSTTGTSVVGSPATSATVAAPSAVVPPVIPPAVAPTSSISTSAIVMTLIGVGVAVVLVALGGWGLIRAIARAGRT